MRRLLLTSAMIFGYALAFCQQPAKFHSFDANANEYISKEVFKNEKTGSFLQISYPKYLNNKIDKSKETDTVFLEVENREDFFDMALFNSENIFDYLDLVWINEETAYLIVNEGEYTFYATHVLYYPDKFIVNVQENINVDSTTHLNVPMEIVNRIQLNGVDENATSLTSLDGYTSENAMICFPLGGGYQVTSQYGYSEDCWFYISDVSSEVDIYLYNFHSNVSSNSKNYFIEYEKLEGINTPITRTNNPNDLVSFDVDYKLPKYKKNDLYFGMTIGTQNLNIFGMPSGIGSFMPMFMIEPNSQWRGEFYADLKDNDKLKSYIMISSMINENSYDGGLISRFDDTYGIDRSMDAFSSTYYLNPEQTICLNQDASFLSTEFYNGFDSDSTIIFYASNIGMLRGQNWEETMIHILNDDSDTVVQVYGNMVYTDFLGCGSYTAIIECNDYKNYNYQGKLVQESSFNTVADDKNPPYIDLVRITDNEGSVLYNVKKNEECFLQFWASDIKLEFDSTWNYLIPRVLPLNNDLTKAYIKLHNENEWNELELDLLDEDTIIGSHYMADISNDIVVDTGALDFKLEIYDLQGNKTTSYTEPFLLIGEYSIGLDDNILEVKGDATNSFPNPFVNETTVEYYLGEISNVKIEIVNIMGDVVFSTDIGNIKQGLNKFIWDGTGMNNQKVKPGVYLINIKTKTEEIVSKVMKLK